MLDDGGVACVDDGGHDWQLVEVHLAAGGADRGHQCARCRLIAYEPSATALGDRRPGLDFEVDDLPAELR